MILNRLCPPVAWFLLALPIHAAPGDLDVAFGSNGGKVTTPFGFARSVALQGDGKIVVAGSVNTGFFPPGPYQDFALARFTTNGALDSSFGTGGKVSTPFLGYDDYGYSVAVQSDGKVVVAGSANNGSNEDFAVARCNPNGSLDASFGTGGKVTTPIGNRGDVGRSVALQGDGKIIVAGSANNGSNEDFALVRYNPNGSLDASFGTGGKMTTPIGSSNDVGRSVVLQGDGKIIVAGSANNGSNEDFAVARYNPNGSLDASFGTGGKVTTLIGSRSDVGSSVALQGDGKIIVAGYSRIGNSNRFALAGYTAVGVLDPSFGTGGKVTTAIGSGDDKVWSLAVQNDGRILVAGTSWNGSDYDIAVARYTANGALDSTFGTDGKVSTPIGSYDDHGWSVALQSDGKIVVAGQGNNRTSTDIALVRYLASGALDASFGIGGKVTMPIDGSYSSGHSVVLQTDGKIVVAGRVSNSSFSGVVLARYTTEGTLDASFGTNGIVTTPGGGDGYGPKVTTQADGKLVVAGASWNGSDEDIVLARYTAAGVLDASFGTRGQVTTPLGSSHDYGNSLAMQSNGKIVVAGASRDGSSYDFALVRYTTNGALDTSFGVGGKITTAIGATYDEGRSLTIQRDGKIVVAGYSTIAGYENFALVRYLGDPVPAITNASKNGTGTFSLSGAGGATQSHILFAATNLLPPIQWTAVATNQSDTNGLFQFTDSQATNFQRRFYRVRSP